MPNEELFSGIPSLDDARGMQDYMNQQTLNDMGVNGNMPAALNYDNGNGNGAVPNTDPNTPAPEPNPAPQFTSDQIQQIIARNAQLEANMNAIAQRQQAAQQMQAQLGQAEYNAQQAAIIKQLIDRGVPLSAITRALQGGSANTRANAALNNRIQAVENYLNQQQYVAEESKFISKMTEFGNKFGLSENDLVTFGNAALEKGINLTNVSDVETVFRAIYPDQYAIRMQRMSNAPSSQIYGGSSTPEAPRAMSSKLEDAYVDQFLKGAMPNAYSRSH